MRQIPGLRDRIGAAGALLGAAAVPLVILATMAAVTSLWVVPMHTLRGLPTAALAVLAPALVGRYVARRHRASYLSLASLGGRLGFGAVLFALGSTDASLETSLSIGAALVGGLWLVTAVLQRLAVDAGDFAPGAVELETSVHRHWHVHWGSHDHQHPEAHGRDWGIHRHRHVHGRSRPGG